MSERNMLGDNGLAKAIQAANETLVKIERQERNFFKMYGRDGNDFLSDFISVNKEGAGFVAKRFMKRFDQMISDVNAHLRILEAKTRFEQGNHSNQATVIRSNLSLISEQRASKVDDDISSDATSSTTDLSSTVQDDLNQIAEIDADLMQLEQRIDNIEKRVQEDVEAEEIGIEFPIADIIDYLTSIKVAMYKRHLLTNQLCRIVLNDERFTDEMKLLKKEFVVWTKEEREDVLKKLAHLEDSLNKLQKFPVVCNDEFNKYYPLMNDMGLLKRLVARFLDKYEMNSSAVPTARLTPSLSLSQHNSGSLVKGGKLAAMKTMQIPQENETSKNAEKSAVLSQGKKIQKNESSVDLHTAIEKK